MQPLIQLKVSSLKKNVLSIFQQCIAQLLFLSCLDHAHAPKALLVPRNMTVFLSTCASSDHLRLIQLCQMLTIANNSSFLAKSFLKSSLLASISSASFLGFIYSISPFLYQQQLYHACHSEVTKKMNLLLRCCHFIFFLPAVKFRRLTNQTTRRVVS